MLYTGMVDRKRLITDPHFHVWKPSTHPHLTNEEFLKSPLGQLLEDGLKLSPIYSILDFMNESKKYILHKSVYLQCGHINPLKETEYLQTIGDKYDHPNGIIAKADLQSDDIEFILKQHMKYKNFRGIRAAIGYHQKYEKHRFCTDPNIMLSQSFHNGLKVMNKYNLIFDCHIYPIQLKYAAMIACAYPNLRIVINHSGYPIQMDDMNDLNKYWYEGIKLLSKCNNVFIKISGWFVAQKKYKRELMKEIIKYIINEFGVNRCMFASNFPVDKPYGEYDYYWDQFIEILKELGGYNEFHIDKLVHLNAIKIYKLDDNPSNIYAKL
eukprot:369885_1